MVPKAQDLDALLREKPVPLLITGALIRESMPPSVCLNCQASFDTKKVEEVNATRVLATKLELFETPIPE